MFRKILLSAGMLGFMASGLYAQESVSGKGPVLIPPVPVEAPVTGVKAKAPPIAMDAGIAMILNDKNLSYELLQPAKIFRIGYNQPPAKEGGPARHQRVLVGSFKEKMNPADPASPLVRRVWSIAYSGPELPKNLSNLLLASNKAKVGGWELIKEQNGDNTVIFDIKADADTPPDTFVWMVQVACFMAESQEKVFEAEAAAAHQSDPNFKPVIDKF